jgi:hypothetical protein
MSTDKDRKNRHEKCMFNFTAGYDKKRAKSFRNADKKRIKEAIEENGGIPPWSIHSLFEECPCDKCKQDRAKNGRKRSKTISN